MMNSSSSMANVASLLFLFLFTIVDGSPECDSWKDLKNFLLDTDKVNCTVNGDCTGMNCAGKYQNFEFKVQVEVKACNEPATIDFVLDAPSYNVKNLTHSLKDGEKYSLPGILSDKMPIDIIVSLKEEANRSLKVGFFVESKLLGSFKLISNRTLVRAECKNNTEKTSAIATVASIVKSEANAIPAPPMMAGKPCNQCSEHEVCDQINGLQQCRCKDGYMYNNLRICEQEVVVKNTSRKCNMSRLHQCEENEICKQIDHEPLGICVCKPSFHEDEHHHCVKGDTPSESKAKTNVTLIIGILVPVCVLLLCIGCVIVLVKKRVIQHIRQRFFNVRRYEVVSIGNDEDDEPLIV